MAYDSSAWRKRLSLRTDMSTYLVHLTRSSTIKGKEYSAVDILLKILEEQKLIGSKNYPGYINGSINAVCFQETPLVSIAQNLHYEEEEKKLGNNTRCYSGVGLMFNKQYIYKNKGRKVFYARKEEIKKVLPDSEWWRIVNFSLVDENKIIDWTHEREWRVPGDFTFEIKEASIIVNDANDYRELISKCCAFEYNILREIQGIVTLTNIWM